MHGDVRAENVIVTSHDGIKLTNFMLMSLTRNAPFASTPQDDTRALARLAYEVYSGRRLVRREHLDLPRSVPRRRRKAIAAVLDRRERDSRPSINGFLADAGLGRRRFGGRAPRDRSTPVWSQRRTLLAVAATFAIGVGVYWHDEIAWQPDPDRVQHWIATAGDGVKRLNAAVAARLPTQTRQGPAATVAVSSDDDPVGASPVALAEPPEGIRAPADRPGQSATATQAQAHRPVTEAVAASRAVPAVHDTASAVTKDYGEAGVGAAPDAGVGLSTKSVTAYENQGMVSIDLIRHGDASRAVDVVWWTSDGTAHAGDDYASFGRRVETLGPGETKRTLYIPLASDALPESVEHFYVHIQAADNDRSRNITVAEVTILDDDL